MTHKANIVLSQSDLARIAEQVPPNESKVDKVTGKSLVEDTAVTDLTNGGETTLHTHPTTTVVTPTSWGKYF